MSAVRGVVQCGQGGKEEVLQMRTSALFDVINIEFFEIYGVSAVTRREGVEPVRTRGEGSIFRDFVRTCP